VTDLIARRGITLVLEIGVFLGGSARIWLETSPELVVIALDSWADQPWRSARARSLGHPEIADQLDEEDGFYRTFLASNWNYCDRIVPVRGHSPDALHAIAETGVQPELVFLDCDKSGRELPICHDLFPDAVLCGDDWAWGTDRWRDVDAGYPIRAPVKTFVAEHGLHLRTHRQTWVADPEAPTLCDRLRQALVDARMSARRLRALQRAARDHFRSERVRESR
jgi:hypothetical protein